MDKYIHIPYNDCSAKSVKWHMVAMTDTEINR